MYLSARCRCPSATVFSALEHRPVIWSATVHRTANTTLQLSNKLGRGDGAVFRIKTQQQARTTRRRTTLHASHAPLYIASYVSCVYLPLWKSYIRRLMRNCLENYSVTLPTFCNPCFQIVQQAFTTSVPALLINFSLTKLGT